MIDIRTYTQSGSLSIPFDWRVVAAKPAVLEMEGAFHTAVILSLFCDKRADRDAVLPHNQTDRRGWCGDAFFGTEKEAWGSLLWTLWVSKTTQDVAERARFYAWESLQWMAPVLADRVDVSTEWTGETGDRLAIRVKIWRAAGNIQPDYDALWGTTIRRQ